MDFVLRRFWPQRGTGLLRAQERVKKAKARRGAATLSAQAAWTQIRTFIKGRFEASAGAASLPGGSDSGSGRGAQQLRHLSL